MCGGGYSWNKGEDEEEFSLAHKRTFNKNVELSGSRGQSG